MADDEMAVLLQEAIVELQPSRKQTEVLVKQNQHQNSELTKEVVESHSRGGSQRCSKPKVEVSVHTEVWFGSYI